MNVLVLIFFNNYIYVCCCSFLEYILEKFSQKFKFLMVINQLEVGV